MSGLSRQALVFTALFLVLSPCLPACLPDFPPPPSTIVPSDGAVLDAARDVGAPGDAGGDAERDARPRDAAPPPDAQGCPPIEVGAASLRFRAWDGVGTGVVRVRAEGGCPPLELLSLPPWLAGGLDGNALTLEVSGPLDPGRQVDAVVLQDARGQTLSVAVTLEHFARGRGRAPKALVVALGGVGQEPLPPVTTWLFERALAALMSNLPPEAVGREAPAWVSLLTGVEPRVHGVEATTQRAAVPSFPARAQAAGHPAAVGSQWAPLAGTIEPQVGVMTGDFDGALAHVLTRLQAPDGDLFVLAIDEPAAARRVGRPVEPALQTTDAALDRLLSAVVERPTFADEDWLIVVAGVPAEGAVLPLAFARPGRPPGPLAAKAGLLDVAPTVLHHLGIPLAPGWELPGLLAGGGSEVECSNEIDDDEDGRFDCRDEDCAAGCDLACTTHDGGHRQGLLAEADVRDLRQDQAGSCGGGATRGLAVRWTAPADDVYLVHTDGSALESVVYVRTRDCAGRELGCGRTLYGTRQLDEPGAVLLEAQAGESFVLFGDPDFFHARGGVQLQLFGQRAECEAATDLGEGQGPVARGSNRGAPTRLAPNFGMDLCDAAEPPPGAYDRLFRWRAPRAGRWRISTEGSTYDTLLRVFGGDCARLVPRACHDDIDREADRLESAVVIDAAAGESLLVVVSGFWRSGRDDDDDQGDFVVTIGPAQ